MSTEAAEFLVTTSEGSPHTICLWDYSAGNTLQVYRNGGTAALHSVSQLGNDYFLSSEKEKPLLHMWPVNSQEPLKNIRLVLPDLASAVAVSPNNYYLAVGIGLKLYIWLLCSGKLLTVQLKHLLPITCVKFSTNTDCVLTSCQGGTAIAYHFGDLVCSTNQANQREVGQAEPLYIRRDHTDAITDIYVGKFGLKSRFATVSNDHTCRLYDLLTGTPLLCFVGNGSLSSVVLDASCWNVFVGTGTGTIHQFNLSNPPKLLTVHLDANDDDQMVFNGHKDRVNCLDLNVTNEVLVSGSADKSVIIWNVHSQQMLSVIEHKGAVLNTRFILRNENLFAPTFKPDYVVKTLQRSIDTNSNNFTVSVIQKEAIVKPDGEDQIGDELEEELLRAKVANQQIYHLLCDHIEKLNK